MAEEIKKSAPPKDMKAEGALTSARLFGYNPAFFKRRA
jgi:hypothetical protein